MSRNKTTSRSRLQPPEGADAALYFLDGQYLFEQVDSGAVKAKFLSAASVRRAFSNESIDSGWLPRGALRWGTGRRGAWTLRWHEPARYRVEIAGQKRRLVVPMPALVFIGVGNSYYIAASKRGGFDPKAELFHAPLPNVNGAGLICFGRNPHPPVERGGFDRAWQMFWEAPFNNDHSHGKSKSHPDRILDKLREVARQRLPAYPTSDLVGLHRTLEDALARLTERRRDVYEMADADLNEGFDNDDQ